MADEIISELSYMGSLTAGITFLFAEAAGLPDPDDLTVFGILNGRVHNTLTLQFAPAEASTEAIALWALRFGAVIESRTVVQEMAGDTEDNVQLWVSAEFTWQDFLHVHAFAHIPLPVKEATASTVQDSEPQPVTPF